MTVGFARYSAESGPMDPHQHAEETIYVVDARDGYIRPGTAANQMGDRVCRCPVRRWRPWPS